MNKTILKIGIIAILAVNLLMIYSLDFFKELYEYNKSEFVVRLLMSFAALILIYVYNKYKHKKYNIDDIIYLKYIIISIVAYMIIIRIIMGLLDIVNNETIYNIVNNYIIVSIYYSIDAGRFETFIFKYSGIYAGLLVTMFVITLNKNSGKNEDEKNKQETVMNGIQDNINNEQIMFQDASQFDIQNTGQFNIKTRNNIISNNIKKISKISGIKAGLIVIICQGMVWILVSLLYELTGLI